MERPNIKDFFPEVCTHRTINKIFLENKELYNYIQTLDIYIDELINQIESLIKENNFKQLNQ